MIVNTNSGYHQSAPLETKAPQSEISREVGSLLGELDTLSRVVGQIRERLEPVLCSGHAEPAVPGAMTESTSCYSPLGQTVRSAAERIDSLSTELAAICDALAL